MKIPNWYHEFPGAITVCDTKGIVLYMNEKSQKTFEKDAGKSLLGKSLLDCHPGASRQKLEHLLKTQTQNTYTIEKNGIKKFIYQTPWFEKGAYKGFVELSLEIPMEMPHFRRG